MGQVRRITSRRYLSRYPPQVPSRLKRYQDSGSHHFLTFSCYRRLALFNSANAKEIFEQELENVRHWYKFDVFGYVVMPEHVHLLVSEPQEGTLSGALQILKQTVSRKLPHPTPDKPFWEARYYDFNVLTDRKWTEKLRYIHRNPVARGLVAEPADWPWSSFRHYRNGEAGTVEIESEWTFRLREKSGILPTFKKQPL
jgi:REP-associated tyrosine transposase